MAIAKWPSTFPSNIEVDVERDMKALNVGAKLIHISELRPGQGDHIIFFPYSVISTDKIGELVRHLQLVRSKVPKVPCIIDESHNVKNAFGGKSASSVPRR